ncbi:MAG: MurR/RpiR family transcriptional regulator [Erysipelotrichaceae bacterium]
MNPIEAITQNLSKLTKKEQAIAEYILSDPIRPVQLSAEEIVTKVGTSKAAFIRFCQKIGYNGYSEFRFAMSRYVVSNVPDDNADDAIKSIIDRYINFIAMIPSMVKLEDVKEVATMILCAKRVKILGFNRTALSARQLRLRLSKLGIDAELIDDQVQMRDVAAYLTKDDLCVIFSIKSDNSFYGGHVRQMAQNKVPILLITMTPNNKLVDDVKKMVTLPFISRASSATFLDDQAIFFVFIELILNELAKGCDIN